MFSHSGLARSPAPLPIDARALKSTRHALNIPQPKLGEKKKRPDLSIEQKLYRASSCISLGREKKKCVCMCVRGGK